MVHMVDLVAAGWDMLAGWREGEVGAGDYLTGCQGGRWGAGFRRMVTPPSGGFGV